jgi:PhzF family phenazine biosynthesis protein
VAIKIFIVDAFTDQLFKGNTAAVCLPSQWPDVEIMQNIALENNLSETVFAVKEDDGYRLRWFTPTTEVDLCGHATLAASHVIFSLLEPENENLKFYSKSGDLAVSRQSDLYLLDFPAWPPAPLNEPPLLAAALGAEPLAVYQSRDLLALFRNQDEVTSIQPDLSLLKQIPYLGVIVTAQGQDVDFVSRFFAPRVGVDEDPVTGSAHCSLIPFWSKRLNKDHLTARQLSPRGGELSCVHKRDRVLIGGHAIMYSQGEILL